jgi:hypothetical protein
VYHCKVVGLRQDDRFKIENNTEHIPEQHNNEEILFILISSLGFTNANLQMLDPVKWTTKIEKKSENTFVLFLMQR